MAHKISKKEYYENDEVKSKMEENKEFWDHISQKLQEDIQAKWLYISFILTMS